MGKGAVLDGALSWTRLVKQGGVGLESTGGHGRGKSGITSWRMLLPALDSPAPALSMKHTGFQPGHGVGVTRDPWTWSWCHQGSMEVLSEDHQHWSHLCFPTGINLSCVGTQQDVARYQILIRSKQNVDKIS